jgi:hypothetical protein
MHLGEVWGLQLTLLLRRTLVQCLHQFPPRLCPVDPQSNPVCCAIPLVGPCVAGPLASSPAISLPFPLPYLADPVPVPGPAGSLSVPSPVPPWSLRWSLFHHFPRSFLFPVSISLLRLRFLLRHFRLCRIPDNVTEVHLLLPISIRCVLGGFPVWEDCKSVKPALFQA